MASFRDKVNSHLPIVLQTISTFSLLILAICAVCGSKSLKRLAEGHSIGSSDHVNHGQIIKGNHNH